MASVTVLGVLRQQGWFLPVLLAGFYLLNLCHRTPLGHQLGVGCSHCPTVKTQMGEPTDAVSGAHISHSRNCCGAAHRPLASDRHGPGNDRADLSVSERVGAISAENSDVAESCLVCEAVAKLGHAWVLFDESNSPSGNFDTCLIIETDGPSTLGQWYAGRGPPSV